jgi:Rieske Fe-S protein
MSETSRRAVLAGVAGLGAATVLAACGTAGEGDSATPGAGDTGGGTAPTTGAAAPPAQTGKPAAPPAGLAKTTDIPVGGGKIFTEHGVVITQPTAGTFKAFSSACTHQGCPVTEVKGGTINCNCHFSKYSVEDGSVKGGPARTSLPTKQVTVQGDNIVLA